ncbi:5-(carboxyamino)imidazole ribonucleotide synthase [Leptolyngbya sp. GGD]|uniref:5-(carboxyamino)imidazole ribonucleotide synthase n=1 Tax=Leptolyngbya sp. GGD TaxID=2997907 RepID=UPI00227C9F3E|nr:5-(carboxyamino)imidazole ribonucleotide synthase [Leptolyngbya sp. GGD]MCY6491448.1 5-(carboxyamino)imidazole ribonucleotide synthase [Leptolyngbya sp. GGD]
MNRVGVIGGGQLAWMMAEAARKLNLTLVVQTPNESDPAVSVAQETLFARVNDASATEVLSTHVDVITFENEFVDLDALAKIQNVIFRPSLSALRPLLDKYVQREFLKTYDLPTPDFWLLGERDVEFPVVLKTRRLGYDGQGTFIIRDAATWEPTIEKLQNVPIVLEEFIPFDRELAVMAARSSSGEIAIYPIVETQQENQVCRRVIAPAEVSKGVQQEIHRIAQTVLEKLDVVGIYGFELFLTKDDRVLVNEIAPRTHNSGHYTIDACETSQFEQQLRAVSDLPLGSPALNCQGALMVNLLGFEQAESEYLEQRNAIAQLPNTFVHWYGKSESRPGRKLGHVTVLLDDVTDLRQQALEIASTIEEIWYRH